MELLCVVLKAENSTPLCKERGQESELPDLLGALGKLFDISIWCTSLGYIRSPYVELLIISSPFWISDRQDTGKLLSGFI
jgi:hypothetical protein